MRLHSAPHARAAVARRAFVSLCRDCSQMRQKALCTNWMLRAGGGQQGSVAIKPHFSWRTRLAASTSARRRFMFHTRHDRYSSRWSLSEPGAYWDARDACAHARQSANPSLHMHQHRQHQTAACTACAVCVRLGRPRGGHSGRDVTRHFMFLTGQFGLLTPKFASNVRLASDSCNGSAQPKPTCIMCSTAAAP